MLTEWLIFGGFFGGLFIARAVVATICFYLIIPEGDRCPCCDAHTLRLEPGGWRYLVPRVRLSWCPTCRWEGLMRGTAADLPTSTDIRVPAGTH
jgi:hypothetical protein